MQHIVVADKVKMGTVLRKLVREHTTQKNRSFRNLSLAVGMDQNFISGFLCADPKKWALPKHPTFGYLLTELGHSSESFRNHCEQCEEAEK